MAGKRQLKDLPPQTREEKIQILANAAPGSTRFRVTDTTGATRWRFSDAVLETDFLHTKPGTKVPVVMRGKPGARKTALQPDDVTSPDQLRQDQINRNPLVLVTVMTPESPEVLNQVMQGLAREAAAMEVERSRLESQGAKTLDVSAKRVQALAAVANVFNKRREQDSQSMIDLEGPVFKAVFSFILDTFKESCKDAKLRPEQVESVFAKLSQNLGGDWSSEARRKMKGALS